MPSIVRITDISTRTVDAGDRDWVFVRVGTDESIVGWGEASLGWQTHGVRGAIGDLEPLLIGEDPRPVERLWQTMTRGLYFKGGIVAMAAVSGIDQALWDIKAKALDVPLYELLGGPVRDRVRTYVNLGSELRGDARDPQAWLDAAQATREAGFDAMKAYPAPPVRALEGRDALTTTVALVEAVREGAGDDADVMVDLHGRTSPAMGIQVGLALEPLRPYFLEEPCQPGNVAAMVEVARAIRVPVATGERLVTRDQFHEHVDARACAVLQPNPCYVGGVSEYRRIAAIAETALIPVAPHNPNGPIATMVNVHLALATPNFLILEQLRSDVPWRREIVDEPLETVDGYVSPPTRPGIGIDVVEDVAAAHPGGNPPPHLVHAPDGSLLDW